MRTLLFICFSLLLSIGQAENQPYTTPPAFMNLYFNFTGKEEPDFPADQKTISQLLIQSELAKNNNAVIERPLVMLLDSSIYVYDSKRQLLFSRLLRTNRSSGFFELTAISHIGPALSYLAKLKENGDPSWKPAMLRLLNDTRAVNTLNAQRDDNWLEQANITAWKPYQHQIKAMIDYATSMAGNYMVSVLNGADFDLNHLQHQFLNGNADYPIPFNNIMVATFMLTAEQSMMKLHNDLSKITIDWANAMIIVRNVAGNNVTSGLTKGTNWMVAFLNALGDNKIPAQHILITPYAEVKSDVGSNPLSAASYDYYSIKIWMTISNRAPIARAVFTDLATIYLPDRPALPGDYGYSNADAIDDFMVRLKHSFGDAREMLSNSVGFWMAGELQAKKWDLNKIAIPGLTSGFPKNIHAYPEKNPAIKPL